MKYMLLFCSDESVERTEEEAAAIDRGAKSWDQKMAERGVLLQAQRLSLASDATTVRVSDGEVLLTDGPFAETKEQMAGFVVLEAADLDEALELTATHPLAEIGSIEVRPFWRD